MKTTPTTPSKAKGGGNPQLVDIMSYDKNKCVDYAIKKGEQAYRGEQLFRWLQKGVRGFDEMTNLPESFRKTLESECYIAALGIEKKLVSSDGTVKYLFSLPDGETVESVFMEYRHGNTVCISTQVGCRMGCTFCASARGGLKRNLTASEMLLQFTTIQKDTSRRVSGVVLMGMGEPLDNYDNVMDFLRLLNDKDGQNIGYRHISLSTCGLIEGIDRLSKEGLPITLSVSLHASNGKIREQIMPVARKYNYDDLLDSCIRYEKTTKRRVTFEYALISGVNDSEEHARELGTRLKGTLCHVNLIPLNETDRKIYKTSAKDTIMLFTKTLESFKIAVTRRRSLGGDISAACGQLKQSSQMANFGAET